MKSVEFYSVVEEKKSFIAYGQGLSPQEALIQTLDVMDLFAAFRKKRVEVEDDIPWIELRFDNK